VAHCVSNRAGAHGTAGRVRAVRIIDHRLRRIPDIDAARERRMTN
jgi:hypothetical protein